MQPLDRAESDDSRRLNEAPSEAISDILRETYGFQALSNQQSICAEGSCSLPALEIVDDTAQNVEPGNAETNGIKVRPGTTQHYCLTVDDMERQFDVYVPKGYDGKTPMPVVYVLAGVTGEGDQKGFMAYDTGMNEKADELGMIVVYPYALSVAMPVLPIPPRVDSWNSPGVGFVKPRSEYDDVNYMSHVIERVNSDFETDPQAEFIVGFSEGGEMAQHLQAILGNFEGVASVHGTLLGTEAIMQDDPSKPVAPALIILGDHDSMLPYEGGRGLMTIHLPRVDQSQPAMQLPAWVEANECAGEPMTFDSDGEKLTVYTAQQCNGMPVTEILRKGGQHAWDGPSGSGWPLVGEKDRDFDTTQVVVDFFLNQMAP